jgi:predicted RND superfamily exporter protein
VSDIPQRFADFLMSYSKIIIVVMLLATAGIGAGAGMVEQSSDTSQFETGSDAQEASEYIQTNFQGDENTTVVQLVQRGDNVLTQEALIESLRLQQEYRATPSINRTLAEQNAMFGVENFVAQAQLQREAMARQQQAANQQTGQQQQARQQQQAQRQPPTLEEQIGAIERIDDSSWTLDELLTENPGILTENASSQALGLMASSYEPGTTTASARVTFIQQQTFGGSVQSPNGFSENITSAQIAMRDTAASVAGGELEYTVFGAGIIFEEIDQSFGDSGAIVGPMALLFVVLALVVAYRDLLDIILGVAGIFAVLIWTFGFMGWTGVAFNQLLLSVPVLLIGLSIDYAIHVFMRHREMRADESKPENIRRSMALALGGVGAALVWVTATAAIGFLANLTSPIGPLRDFGVVSAFGVTSALLIFGALIPALKVELDSLLERIGLDRKKRAFGTGESRFSRVLATGATAARRFPVAVVAVTLLLTVGGAVGATQVDTSFQQEDFLADSPPEWTQDLPEPFAPGEYQAKEDLDFISANFQQEGNEGEILIRGSVTGDGTLQAIADANENLENSETAFRLPNGDLDIQSPLSLMQQTAAANPQSEFAQNFAAAAGVENPTPRQLATAVPQQNVASLYDQLFALNPEASQYIYRTENGEYEALRLSVALQSDATGSAITSDLRDAASTVEASADLDAAATGDRVVQAETEDALLSTVVQGLVITLVAVFLFLAIAYRLTGNPASLGVVTLAPVVFSVAWILGSMWLLDISFNALTGTITSLTVGLGIAYSIHISSRYELELRRQEDVWDAMETTVTGTGGALLGSAATTVGGFGTLVFAILPVLRQFGIITGLTIIYAFLASVLILPSLLVLWTRYLGPSGYFPDEESPESQATEETAAVDD